jgi:predicted RNase H-like HicB family nuclease
MPEPSGLYKPGKNQRKEEAIVNIQEAINGYIQALVEDSIHVPDEHFEALLVAV